VMTLASPTLNRSLDQVLELALMPIVRKTISRTPQ
jgi:hypothetical protein